ncbi:MAG: nuclear transport factor 2 family protein [Acidimicrobiales bacterium]
MRTPAEHRRRLLGRPLRPRLGAIAGFFRPDSIYYDVLTGPGAAAMGPDDIVKRLKLGLEQLAGYDHGPATVVSEGSIVVTEHAEHWRWPTGEEVTLPFVSIQHVHDA